MNDRKTSIALAVTGSALFLVGCSTHQPPTNGNDGGSPAVASQTASDDPWNIMVVPSRQTAFSGNARELFNKNCASCHSQDGRAQTPIARQHIVHDLSESKLEDAAIIQQILEGTHNKAHTFKMRAFKDKLTRAEIESLVPLVKAFRPVPPSPSDSKPGDGQSGKPRLVGIINLGSYEFAIFEKVHSSGRYFMLREKESHDGVTLIKLNLNRDTAKLEVGGTNLVLSLTPDGQAGPPERTGISGWFMNLGDALSAAPEGVVLNGANTDLVLFLVSQFTGQTLIRSPRLPNITFDLRFGAGGTGEAGLRLKKALRARGIAVISDGGAFLLVVPEAEAPAARILASNIKSAPHTYDRSGLFPGGAIINLPDTNLSQVLDLYADVTGRRLDRTQTNPSLDGAVKFTTQTPLTTEECVCALETLFALHGLNVVNVGGDAFRIEAVSDASQ